MKFTCTKENLQKTIQQIIGITNKRGNLPILDNVLIEVKNSKVEFISTNLEMALKANLRAKVEIEGSFTVPAKTLSDFVNLLPEDQIYISLDNSEFIVECGNSITKIKGANAEDFPVVPEPEEKHSFVLNVDNFKESLSKVIFAAAKNEIRQELSGVYFGFFTNRFSGLIMAATDSYRLAEKKQNVLQGEDNFECIVPAKTLFELTRILSLVKEGDSENNIRLWFSDNQILIRYSNFELSSRLIDGKYPDYSQIIPLDFKTKTSLPIDVFIKKIKTAGLFTANGVNSINIELNNSGAVTISSLSSQTGEYSTVLDVSVSGDSNKVVLNPKYIIDGVNNFEGDVNFNINSNDGPCLFRDSKDQNYLYIVMPIRQ